MNRSLLLIILSLFVGGSLFGRDVGVLVEDTELGLPLEGAVIRSWDGRQYVCGEDGRALVSVPEERQVVIQAVYPGYENGRLTIPTAGDSFTLGLRLSGVMQNRELVLEAERPGSAETRTGRSVALSARDIAQTAEIGIIEDVMSAVKLLPGVAYAGIFNAQPSIRGGFPGDMSASLDGFYIFNPYHWGGGFSIFDPRMVESAQLSHGVFSARYGHTISGLLEVTSKNPSSTEMEFEWGTSTSASSVNFSVPLAGKGGILLMGRITRYDPIIYLAQQLAKKIEILEPVNAISTAPYIRSATITGNYRFTDNLDFRATGFFGMDGVGVQFDSDTSRGISTTRSNTLFNYTNYQAFLITGLSWNPRNNMLMKFTAGTGYTSEIAKGYSQNSIGEKHFSDNFREKYPDLVLLDDTYDFFYRSGINGSDAMLNVQGRIDYDWEPGSGFLIAAGVQEMFSRYNSVGEQQILVEKGFVSLDPKYQQMLESFLPFPAESNVWKDLRVSFPMTYRPDAHNSLFSTSGYALAEYVTPDKRFVAELGLRVDHFVLVGAGIFKRSKPTLNPRLNMDFNVFKNKGWVESFDLSAGTGLFSSVNDNIFFAEERFNIDEVKPNRSWTSVLGTKLEFSESVSVNIEAYYKYVFDRMYATVRFDLEDDQQVQPHFNGIGMVWGVDVMLRRAQSRFWDGWISYSYSWAKYRDPDGFGADRGISGGSRGSDWYFPGYHRFHYLNLILNIKPSTRVNIYTRFGIASGTQLYRRITAHPDSYPLFVLDLDDPLDLEKGYFLEKYTWPSVVDESYRTTPMLPMDIKLSISGKNDHRKTRYELYVAVENVLSLVYSSKGTNTSYNAYTGEENPSVTATYGIPIPVPSFGFTFSY